MYVIIIQGVLEQILDLEGHATICKEKQTQMYICADIRIRQDRN